MSHRPGALDAGHTSKPGADRLQENSAFLSDLLGHEDPNSKLICRLLHHHHLKCAERSHGLTFLSRPVADVAVVPVVYAWLKGSRNEKGSNIRKRQRQQQQQQQQQTECLPR